MRGGEDTDKQKNMLIKKLLSEKICFAVCVSIRTFKISSIEDMSRDYFLIAFKRDLKKIGEKIDEQDSEYSGIQQHDMNKHEILFFKQNINEFIKIQHNELGRIYELKNNSFKKYYDSKKTK